MNKYGSEICGFSGFSCTIAGFLKCLHTEAKPAESKGQLGLLYQLTII